MTEDVKEVCAKFPLAAVALFGTGFVLAAVAFIVTELVSEWQGSGEGGAGRGGCDGSSTCHVSLVHSLDVKEALNRRGIYVIASTCHSSIRST